MHAALQYPAAARHAVPWAIMCHHIVSSLGECLGVKVNTEEWGSQNDVKLPEITTVSNRKMYWKMLPYMGISGKRD